MNRGIKISICCLLNHILVYCQNFLLRPFFSICFILQGRLVYASCSLIQDCKRTRCKSTRLLRSRILQGSVFWALLVKPLSLAPWKFAVNQPFACQIVFEHPKDNEKSVPPRVSAGQLFWGQFSRQPAGDTRSTVSGHVFTYRLFKIFSFVNNWLFWNLRT